MNDDDTVPWTSTDELEFESLEAQSRERIVRAASAWRTGSAGMFAVVSAGTFLGLNDLVMGLTGVWKISVAALGCLGAACLLASLLAAMSAEVGVWGRTLTRDEIQRNYGRVSSFTHACTRRAGERLAQAQLLSVLAFAALGSSMLLCLFAPRMAPA
jgi:hypothetical protein